MAVEDDNFFSRWSRRKAQVRSGETPAAEPPAPVVARAAAPPAASLPAESAPTEQAAPSEQAPPPLTLDDVAGLTPESDFKAFVARNVSPEVRNAAVKKLFADPRFNVMDGLDIYIDDYSQPSPLSAAMMAKMVGAQFLKLVDDPNEAKPTAVSATSALDNAPDTAPDPVAEPSSAIAPSDAGAQPASQATAPDPNQTPHDDHADLQLQPDHDPERESAGRGTG